MNRRMTRAFALLLLAALATGCPKRVDFGPLGPLEDAEEVLARVRAVQGAVERLTGDAKLSVDSAQARGTVGLFAAAARPAFMRVELFDFFNRPLGLLVVNGDRFGFYSPQEGRFLTGPASPANVSRFLPLALPVEELVAVLLGEAPLLADATPTLEVDREVPAYVLRLRAGGAEQRLVVHPRFFRVMRSELRGVTGYDLSFDDFLEEGGLVFPRHVVLGSQAARARMELRYAKPSLNPEPDPGLFVIEPPPGVPVVEVDAHGEPVPGSG